MEKCWEGKTWTELHRLLLQLALVVMEIMLVIQIPTGREGSTVTKAVPK